MDEDTAKKKFIELCRGMSDSHGDKLVLDVEKIKKEINIAEKLRRAIG